MNARFEFSGKTAMVTGAGSGIGRACALAFAQAGAWVVLADRNEAAASDVLAKIQRQGGHGAVVPCDVRDADSVRAAVEMAVRLRGALDFAANAAGIEGSAGALLSETDDLFDQVLDVNLRGVWHCMRAQIQQMTQQAKGGAIVNVSSAAGLVGSQRCATYSASKHAVIGLTRSAALQYAKQGVRVNAICPAGVATPMAQRIASNVERLASNGGASYPLGRYSTPEEIAASILWLCSDGAGSCVGSVLTADAGFTAA